MERNELLPGEKHLTKPKWSTLGFFRSVYLDTVLQLFLPVLGCLFVVSHHQQKELCWQIESRQYLHWIWNWIQLCGLSLCLVIHRAVFSPQELFTVDISSDGLSLYFCLNDCQHGLCTFLALLPNRFFFRCLCGAQQMLLVGILPRWVRDSIHFEIFVLLFRFYSELFQQWIRLLVSHDRKLTQFLRFIGLSLHGRNLLCGFRDITGLCLCCCFVFAAQWLDIQEEERIFLSEFFCWIKRILQQSQPLFFYILFFEWFRSNGEELNCT